MAIVYAEDVVEIAVEMTIGSSIPAVNVWHLEVSEGFGSGDVDAVNLFRDAWQDRVMPQLASAIQLHSFNWRSLDPDDNNVGTVQPNPAKPVIGGRDASMLPPNTAFLVHKNTTNRPRGRRDGRAYLPGVLESIVDNAGAIDSANIASMNTSLAGFFNDVDNGTTVFFCVLETTPLSRQKGTLPVTIGKRRVSSLTIDGKVATQRDRLR